MNRPIKEYFPFFLLPFVFFLITACPEPFEEPPRDTTIRLNVESTGITAVSLKVSVGDTTDFWTFGLSRNDSIVLIESTTLSETIVQDAGLTPTTEYRYKAFWLKNGTAVDSSAEVTAVTGDTTGHNFLWTVDTLGAYGSFLWDVAVVDENNVWVVGALSIPDSADYFPSYANYNAAHWNGSEWALKKIMPPNGYITTVKCIYTFQENDIWFGRGGLPFHWDGIEFYQYTPANSTHPGQPSIKAIWGTSSSDIYFVGGGGSIVHYNGSTFTKMESGTEVDLRDVWGMVDEETGEEVVWACGYDDESQATVLLVNRNGQWSPVYDATRYRFTKRTDSLSGAVVSVWSSRSYLYVQTGFGLYRCPLNTTGEGEIILHRGTLGQVRGTGDNDIFLVDSNADIRHFNGSTWRYYPELTNDIDRLSAVSVTSNSVFSVGYRYYNGIEYYGLVIRGRRN